ncbi:hypothetical protein QFZ57_004148 [Arthrobacter sp. B1I2]|nr:hypothetical protein [Arthrobacter sp. B1I2]
MSFAIIKPRNQATVATVSAGVILLINSRLWLQMPVVDPMSLALVAWTAAAGGVGSAVHSQRGYVQAPEGQTQGAAATRRAIEHRTALMPTLLLRYLAPVRAFSVSRKAFKALRPSGMGNKM